MNEGKLELIFTDPYMHEGNLELNFPHVIHEAVPHTAIIRTRTELGRLSLKPVCNPMSMYTKTPRSSTLVGAKSC